MLTQLAAHADTPVRAATATHPQLPARELSALARDNAPAVRRALAANPALRLPHQAALVTDPDPAALHVIIQDQAGFHLPISDPPLPPNLRLLPLPSYCPELNPVERLGSLIKAQVCNRLYPTLARLERHIEAVAKDCVRPAKVAALIHDWLLNEVNAGAAI